MSSYKPLPIGNTTKKTQKKFESAFLIAETASINSIEFNPVDSDQYLITCGLRAKVYHVNSSQPVYSENKIKNTSVYSGTFRRDGEFFALGARDGVVKVVSPHKKIIMKQFEAHRKAPTYCVRWLDVVSHLLTFSDDHSIKCFDFLTEMCVQEYSGHTAEVRIGAVEPNSNNCFLSGSMDNTVRFYDQRVGATPIYTLETGEPVESLLYLPTGNSFVSAGGVAVKIWDASSRKLVHNFVKHADTVSSLSLSSSKKHLLTGSVDGMVHAYNLSNYNIDWSLSTSGRILSMAIGAEDEFVVVGTTDGYINPWKRVPEPVAPTFEPYQRFGQKRLFEDDFGELHTEPGNKLSKTDRFLIHFEHGRALEEVLTNTTVKERVDHILPLLRDLINKSALEKALKKINLDCFNLLCQNLGALWRMTEDDAVKITNQTIKTVFNLYKGRMDDNAIREPLLNLLKVIQEVKKEKDTAFQWQTIVNLARTPGNF